VPIHGIKVHLGQQAFQQVFVEPGHRVPAIARQDGLVVELPPLELHQMLVLD
jgi:hypothetical protein